MSSAIAGAESVANSFDDEKLAKFVEMAQKQRAMLVWVALRVTSSREEAEDIVQEALLKAFRALPRFRGDSRMDTWLHTIVHNAAVEYLRNRKGRIEISLDQPRSGTEDAPPRELADPGKNPEEFYARKEIEDILRSGMNEMTSMCRLAIQMCILQELPYRAVANDLNVTLSALKSRVFHGKRMLRSSVRVAGICGNKAMRGVYQVESRTADRGASGFARQRGTQRRAAIFGQPGSIA